MMRRQIKVRIVESSRDGFVLKWRDRHGDQKQCACGGGTQRARETFRKRKERDLNDPNKDDSWDDFYDQFKAVGLAGMSESHCDKCDMMSRRLLEVASRHRMSPLQCSDVSARLILGVEADQMKRDIVTSTIRSNMATLWSIVTWGQDQGLLPEFRRPRKRRGKSERKASSKAKGRALSGEEIDRLIAAIPHVTKMDEPPAPFVRAVHACRLLGMRKTECWNFAIEMVDSAHYPVRLGSTSPAMIFSADQKSGEVSEVPLTPEAAEWIRALDAGQLWPCRTSGRRGPHQSPDRLGRVVAAAGRKAGIVVKRTVKRSGDVRIKYASLHDLRRTYARTLMRYLDVSETTRMTRHADASVLLDYYSDAPTPELFAKVCGGFSGGSDRRSREQKDAKP